MSAISSAGSGAQITLLQQLQQGDGTGSFSRADFQKRRQADFNAALQAVGVDSSKADDLQKQIQDAIQKVLSGTDTGTDKRSAVKAAVDGVLKQNGIDPAKFQEALKAQEQKSGGAQHAHHKHGARQSDQSGQTSDQSAQLLKALADGTATQGEVSGLPAGSLVDVAA